MIEGIVQKVSERYARAVASGERLCCPVGYNFDDLKTYIPVEVLNSSYGCGTPAGIDTVQPGEIVLDIGSGAGLDCFIASRLVGPSGRVIGVDMTDSMLALARRNAPIVANNLGYESPNVEFRKGTADALPLDDSSVDVIISNCVINLAPDKRRVFREMFRVLKPGGRFTISDIVADQTVPQYLVHDEERWGNCLSGALPVADYLWGLCEAGFLAVHQKAFRPWQVIDGIHFLSLTLTGYKLASSTRSSGLFATLCGPFSRIVTELGQSFERGVPEPVTPLTARLLQLPPLAEHFVLSDRPIALAPPDPRYLSVLPEQGPCVWQGEYAILTGPFAEVCDDDQHRFRRGEPVEICSKTAAVLGTAHYQPHFAIMNRSGERVAGTLVACSPDGSCC
jgi:SAM-dependent methyltransferase